MTQLTLPLRPANEALIERRADEIKAEVIRMAESARRSIGQLTRLDHFHRRMERA